jgi:hypothetical protein
MMATKKFQLFIGIFNPAIPSDAGHTTARITTVLFDVYSGDYFGSHL